MTVRLLAALVLVLVLSAPPAVAETSAIPRSRDALTFSFAPLVEKTAPAVVNIYARRIVRPRSPAQFLDGSAVWNLFRDTFLFGYGRERIENSLGSGVIVRPEGIVVTNHHVVEAADGTVVALADGRTFPAEILLSDRRTDVAVLRIAAQGLPFIELGDSDRLKVGDLVLAIGNPFGLGQTVTSGIVSALARTTVGVSDLRFFIQSDAAINPGNSGGAQIGMDGRLVGINTAIYGTMSGAQGLGFAVPANMVAMIVERAVAGEPLMRPWIGVSGSRVPPQVAALLGLPRPQGVLVTGLYEGSPAERAGIAIGDVILSVDGFPVDELQALRYRIATQIAGSSVRLSVFRRGSSLDIAVVLEPPPDEPVPDETRLAGLSPLGGARVASLSPALAEDLGLDSGIAGVLVLEVTQGSAAERLGLVAGDVIRAIGERRVRTVRELLDFRPAAFGSWSIRIIRSGQDIAIGKQ